MITKDELEIRNVRWSTMVGEWPSSLTVTVKREGVVYFQKYYADKRARGVISDRGIEIPIPNAGKIKRRDK